MRILWWVLLLLKINIIFSLYSSPNPIKVFGRRRLFGDKLHDTTSAVPRHVAFIVDGNGRWAEQRGLSRPEGHTAGANVTVEIVKAAFGMGVEVVTLYLFSTG